MLPSGETNENATLILSFQFRIGRSIVSLHPFDGYLPNCLRTQKTNYSKNDSKFLSRISTFFFVARASDDVVRLVITIYIYICIVC